MKIPACQHEFSTLGGKCRRCGITQREIALGPLDDAPSTDQKENVMHYRNGREAKNGDQIVQLSEGKIVAVGVLHSAVPGNDHCNGHIAPIQSPTQYACLCDALHVEDVSALLKEKGLDKRPAGK
jgi:hypothetical protein